MLERNADHNLFSRLAEAVNRVPWWVILVAWVLSYFVAAVVMVLAFAGCGDPCDSWPGYEHPQPAPDRAEPIIDTREGTRLADNGSSKFQVQSFNSALLAAIRAEESSGHAHPPDGDGGRAIGPYQIHEGYWLDSRQPGRYADCRGEPYARRVVLAYFKRYEPEALARGDADILARLHNGGPTRRVKAHLSAEGRM
jgi:hypothetical protein